MNLIQKQKQNEREKTKQKLHIIIAIFTCVFAPIATYLISPNQMADANFMNLLAWILIFAGAFVFAIEKGPGWWLLVCFYTAFWHVMLIGVPLYGLENLQTAEYGEGLIWYFFANFCLTMILSGVLGIILKIAIRINTR